MDEVWVIDRALADAEIAALRTDNNIPEPASAIVAVMGIAALVARKRWRR